MISFKALIAIGPFREDQKKTLLEIADQLTEEQKFRLSNAAWQGLAQQFYGRLEVERQKIMEDVVMEGKKINKNDFEEVKAKLLHEFAQKLQAAESKESMDEVRRQLEQFKTKPLAQDASSSPQSRKP